MTSTLGSGQIWCFRWFRSSVGRCTRVLGWFHRSGQKVAAESVGFGKTVKTRFKSAGISQVFLKVSVLLNDLDRRVD